MAHHSSSSARSTSPSPRRATLALGSATAIVLSLTLSLTMTVALSACLGDGEVVTCKGADDCAAPFLCCTAGATVEAEGGPHCVIPDPSLSFCDAYVAHLVEGNPCGRAAMAQAPATVGGGIDPIPAEVDLCRDGLLCCPATLTCTSAGDCKGAPPGGPSSGGKCHADGECKGDEICCGISYYYRDGTCSSVSDCSLSASGGSSAASGSASSGGG